MISLLSVSVSLLLSYYIHYLLYFLDSTHKWYHTVFVFLCMTYCQHPLAHRKSKNSRKTSTSDFIRRSLWLCDRSKLWEILKETGTPDHLSCLLRNLCAGQEATLRTRHGTTDWFQIGKGVHQGCISSPCLFNLYAEYSMRNAGLEEAQAGI